ncbi:hypothetical protein J4729_10730 [Leisingera sp. HS039]|uniref:hypothetical protein n=1 Tax=unclassified Leisingera TaxID=2614906 RepID=UPI0010709A92|nr:MULTISPECIES: hypothetical protein [unclassified Leisingera]MBQ4825018.1 hypothetical protein [Leisingera sp. HS039]QBR36100.1 hypothetical protein ETW23_08055 [Leisingera sp. NJS201]
MQFTWHPGVKPNKQNQSTFSSFTLFQGPARRRAFVKPTKIFSQNTAVAKDVFGFLAARSTPGGWKTRNPQVIRRLIMSVFFPKALAISTIPENRSSLRRQNPATVRPDFIPFSFAGKGVRKAEFTQEAAACQHWRSFASVWTRFPARKMV